MSVVTDRLVTRMEMSGLRGVITGMMQLAQVQKELQALTVTGTAQQQAQAQAHLDALRKSIMMSAKAAAIGIGVTMVMALAAATLETEKLQNRMRGLFGSGAGQSFKFLSSFSADTRSDLDDVRKAFLNIGDRGVQPTRRIMLDLVKLAKLSGKSMEEVSNPMAEALLGNKGALEGFGISMRDIARNGGGAAGVLKAIDERTRGITPGFEDLTGAVNRLASAWRRLMEVFTGDGGGIFKMIVDFITHVVDGVTMVAQTLRLVVDTLNLIRVFLASPMAQGRGPHKAAFAQFAKDFKAMDSSKDARAEPGKLEHPSLGQWNPMAAITRQLIGGLLGPIGRIGIRASEIPGVQARRVPPITIHVEGDDPKRWLENGVRQAIEQLVQHGALHPGPQSMGVF